jgi:hypothetical protein
VENICSLSPQIALHQVLLTLLIIVRAIASKAPKLTQLLKLLFQLPALDKPNHILIFALPKMFHWPE